MMELSQTAYCRLCAKLKPHCKLINLLTDEIKRREIEEKLVRVNAIISDLCEDILPLTMCLMCLSSLDRAFEFVLIVEQSQSALNDLVLVQQIKKEAEHSDSENSVCNYSPCEKLNNEVEVKIEVDRSVNHNKLTAVKKEKKPIEKSSLNKKLKESLSLDSIPLSQLKMTWRDYSWTCAYCETQFSSVDELRNHSMQYHNCCNAYRCTDCNIRKLKLNSFLIHVRRHRKYLKLSCYKCDFKFKGFTDAKNHSMSHITSQHMCLGCNTCYTNTDELNNHQESFFKDKRSRGVPQIQTKNSLTCVICDKTFKNKASLNTHLLTHTDRTRDHICEVCGKCFLHKSNLLGHMTLHNDARPYQCKICKCSFKTAHHLRRHVGIHDGQKPYACDQCGRCFRLQKQLKSHSIIHTDSLPHICSYCNKSFRFKTILSQHLRQHTGVKPYSCSICQRDFTNWPNFNKHMKRRHNMDMAKKKHTPDGVYPINPITGEMVVHPETNATMEWKKSMMLNRRPGRPKTEYKQERGHSEEKNSNSKT